MPWWGWLIISVLGFLTVAGVVFFACVLHALSHMFDSL